MDKKNTTIGALLLLAAFASLYLGHKLSPPPPPAPELTRPLTANPLGANQAARSLASPTSPSDTSFAAVVKDDANAQVTTLGNDFIEAHFTDFGGAIRDVALKKYDAEKIRPGVPYVFNQQHADPALAFIGLPGLDRHTRYQLVSSSASEVVYRAVFENRVEVTRRYTLFPTGTKDRDPYQVRHETTFRNLTDQTTALPHTALSLGTAAPLNAKDPGIYLTTGLNAGGDISFTKRSALEGGGFLSFLGVGSRAPLSSKEVSGSVVWGSVSNQFFTAIFTPDKPGSGLVPRVVELRSLPRHDLSRLWHHRQHAHRPSGVDPARRSEIRRRLLRRSEGIPPPHQRRCVQARRGQGDAVRIFQILQPDPAHPDDVDPRYRW